MHISCKSSFLRRERCKVNLQILCILLKHFWESMLWSVRDRMILSCEYELKRYFTRFCFECFVVKKRKNSKNQHVVRCNYVLTYSLTLTLTYIQILCILLKHFWESMLWSVVVSGIKRQHKGQLPLRKWEVPTILH